MELLPELPFLESLKAFYHSVVYESNGTNEVVIVVRDEVEYVVIYVHDEGGIVNVKLMRLAVEASFFGFMGRLLALILVICQNRVYLFLM